MTPKKLLLAIFCAHLVLVKASCPKECRCSDKKFDCSNESLESISFTVFDGTEVLDISSNDITFDKSSFENNEFASLQTLFIDNNNIEGLHPEVFKNLKELKQLYLRNNYIESLSVRLFANNPNLITLDLSGNKLACLYYYTFEKNTKLFSVNISANPVNISSFSSSFFSYSLNVIDAVLCRDPEPYIRSFQNIPFLKHLKDNVEFTLQDMLKEIEDSNFRSDILSVLNKSGVDSSSTLKYIANKTISHGNKSIMCFCSRLSAWFWCNTRSFSCERNMLLDDMYSFLKCDYYSEFSNVTTEIIPETSPVSSLTSPSTSAEVEEECSWCSTEIVTTGNTGNDTAPEMSERVRDIVLYGSICGGMLIVVLVVVICCYVCIRRRRSNSENRGSFLYLAAIPPEPTRSQPIPARQNKQLHYFVSDPLDLQNENNFEEGSPGIASNVRDNGQGSSMEHDYSELPTFKVHRTPSDKRYQGERQNIPIVTTDYVVPYASSSRTRNDGQQRQQRIHPATSSPSVTRKHSANRGQYGSPMTRHRPQGSKVHTNKSTLNNMPVLTRSHIGMAAMNRNMEADGFD